MTLAQSLRLMPLLLTLTGCVERRFVVETNVPGAQVYVNNAPVGPSPADARWDYPGKYEFRVVSQGFEPLTKIERVKPRWYDYPGIDFLVETLWPFHIEDVRRYHFDLVPATKIPTDVLIDSANALRAEGQNLPAPKYPDPVKPRP